MSIRPPDYDRRVPDYYAWSGDIPVPAWIHFLRSDTTTRERGLYATARWNPRDDLKLITGGRVINYTSDTTRKSGIVVPYLGAVYDLNPQLSAYASYTTIYKPQSAQTREGATLDPLEGQNKEVGLKGTFLGGRLQASAAYFQLDQDNYPEYTSETTPSGGSAARATQGVKTRGYELEVSGQPAPRWQVHAGFSHKISRRQGQKVATLTPENVFTLHAGYKPSLLPGLTLGGGIRWQDKTWGMISAPGGQSVKHTVDDLLLVDLMARYDFTKQLSGSVKISNLLDEKYYTIFNWYSTYTWGEPRNIMVNLRYQF
jgi:outer membrane receptor for ferric coprogen and ferric-rhodotorulic acid